MSNHTCLAAGVGLEHPTAEEARRLDRKRTGKRSPGGYCFFKVLR
jgi:hypothetical protein